MGKGQVEFIAIIGIVAVVIVAVYYASTALVSPGVAPGAPTYTAPEQASVAETVNSFIRDGTSEAMRSIYAYGGYTEAQSSSVMYLGKEVSYWMKDGSSSYPNIRQNLVQGITSYINNNKANLEQALEGQGVTLGSATVSATVMPSQLVVSVNMPTTVKGNQMPQPYVVTIPTKLGEIEEFSKALVEFQKTERFFEWATISSMWMRPLSNGVNSVPFWVSAEDCGTFIHIDKADVMPEVEAAVEDTMAHTYMPGKVPENLGDSTSFPKYGLPQIGGKSYSDLGVTFALSDSFDVDNSNYQMSPNPVIVTPKIVPMTAMCYSAPVLVKHYLSYPMIAVVKDPLTGELFRFASSVFIKDNEPGEWSDTGAYSLSVSEEICQTAGCVGRITLKDASGSPVKNAGINFIGCSVGSTDENGFLEAVIPCGTGTLTVSKSGYDSLGRMYSSSDLNGIEIVSAKKPAMSVNFYEVRMQNVTPSESGIVEQYFVAWPDGVTAVEDDVARLTLASKEDGELFDIMAEEGIVSVDHIPAGEYGVAGTLYSSDLGEIKGEFGSEYYIGEFMDGKSLNVYIPTILGYGGQSEDQRRISMTTLAYNLEQCGLGPVTSVEDQFTESCVVKWTA